MKNKRPLIYIILPVYNGEKYLLQQLMSIYFQKYKNWYLIIINDGSTDSTETIINQYIKNYCLEKKCTVIKQPNSGVNKSVERGLIKAKNLAKETKNNDAYITFCDSDDILMTNKLSYQINFMETHKDCELSYHDLILIDENNAILKPSFINELNKSILTNTKCEIFYEFALSNHLPSNTPMFKVNKIDILLPFPTIFPFHDWRTALVFSGNNYKIKRIKKALGYYRKYNNGTSESGKKYNIIKIFKDFVNALKELQKKVKDKNKINEINQYIKYYTNRIKREKKGRPKIIQLILLFFHNPKIIIYKIMTYFNKG